MINIGTVIFRIILLNILFTQLLFAEDFTIRVPVNVTNMRQEITKINVGCSLSHEEEGGQGITIVSKQIFVDMPASGNFNQTVELKVNAYANNAHLANKVRCDIRFKEGNNNPSFEMLPSNSALCSKELIPVQNRVLFNENILRCAKENEEFTPVVTQFF